MTDLPPTWETVRLDEIAEVRLGRQRSPKNHTGANMRPYMRAANVDWTGLKLDDVKEMHFTEAEVETYRLRPGDLILSEASGSAGEVGKPALWNGEIEDCCIQNTLLRVRATDVEPKYLLHFFRYEALRGAFGGNARGVGIHHLGAAKLAGWLVPLPPLAEQRRIVAHLDTQLERVEEVRTLVSAAGHKVRQLIRATRNRHILGPLSLPASAQGANGWRWARLQEVLNDIEAGKSFVCEPRPARGDEWGVIKVSAMTWGEFREKENKAIPAGRAIEPRFEIRTGDILVSRANTSAYVGAPVLVNECRPQLLLSDKSLRLQVRPEVSKDWLIQALSSSYVREQISERATGTSDSMRNISQKALQDVKLPMPPLEQQSVVASAIRNDVSNVEPLIQVAQIAGQRVTELRNALLRAAFEGQLSAQYASDEPAADLLLAIRAKLRAMRAQGQRGRDRVSDTNRNAQSAPTNVETLNRMKAESPLVPSVTMSANRTGKQESLFRQKGLSS